MQFKAKDQTSEKEISKPIATSQQPRRGSGEKALELVPVAALSVSETAKELFKKATNQFFQQNFKEAVVLLRRCNTSHAQAILGFCYEFGLGVKQDFVMAERDYILAASEDNKIGLAYCRLSFLRYYGRPSVVIDRSEAEEWKRKALDLGDKATEWLEVAANKYKIPAANYAFGVCFHDGVGVEKNPETAILYYKRAAAMGDPRGEATLGFCYGEGFGVEKDQSLAFSYYMRSAERGESVSMYNVGYCYEQGLFVTQSNDEAIKWYTRSAALGNCYAQNSLGYIYEVTNTWVVNCQEGQGVGKDHVVAATWYKKSALQGYPWAQCNYAYCLQNGLGLESNPDEGCYWYKKAALQGHSRAQHNLGHLYQYGIGTAKDEKLAVEWYTRSAAASNAFAMHSLGYCYQHGIGVEVNEQMAFGLYLKSAKLDHAPAQLVLANCYRNGTGTEISDTDAFFWIEKSAAAENDVAQNTLGHFYEDGIGCTQDLAKAAHWYKLSTQQGNVWAITNLAILYLEGLGLTQNISEAVALLRVASKKGHTRAQIKLADLLREGKGCEKDEAGAFNLYKLAADEGSASAMFSVADLLENGIGCEEDRDLAIQYYERAALHGDAAASDRLIALVGNHAILGNILEYGFAAKAAVVYRKGLAPKGVEVHDTSSSSDDDTEKKDEKEEERHEVFVDKRLQRLQSTIHNSLGEIKERRSVVEEVVNDEQDEDARRARIRQKLLENRKANHAARSPEAKEVDVNRSEETDEEESSSADDEISDEDQLPTRVLFKPVFVSKSSRDTIAANEVIEAKQRKEEEDKIELNKSRKKDASGLVIDALRKEALEAEHHLATIDLDDTDGLHDVEELAAWKIRELLRIKRDREQREYRLVDDEDIQRRRNLTDSQIELENRDDGKLGAEKTKLKFMQKYYHKGAFYAGDKAVEEALKRTDTSAPTLEDHQDKLVLPDIMKVKNFGKAGRTKYTHLVDQDTTGMDTAWAKSENISHSVVKRMGGMKAGFEKPGKRRKI